MTAADVSSHDDSIPKMISDIIFCFRSLGSARDDNEGTFHASSAATKIRILSDIFTIFASWTSKRIKVIKRALKIFWRFVVATSCLLFAVALTIQLPQVQTYVADKVMTHVSERLDGDITFEKIHLKPFTTLVLKNVVITDRNPVTDPTDSTSVKVDTFFRSEYIIARFTIDGLFKHEGLHIDKVFIDNARMNLVIEDMNERRTKDNLSRIFMLKKPEVRREPKDKELFHIRKVEIHDMGFAMKNYRSDKHEHREGGIDWDDLDIRNIELNARELQFRNGIMTGELLDLTFDERSGYSVDQISGTAKVGRGKTIIEDLVIDDPWSDVRLPLFMMSYADVKAFQDFIAQVRLDAEIAGSVLDFKTISYFSPALAGNSLRLDVTGSMSGHVDDFMVTDMDIDSKAGGFKGRISGRISGLPEIEDTYVDARLSGFVVTSRGIGDFVSQWMPGEEKLDISRIAKGTVFRLNGKGSGMMDRLKVYADISSDIGKAEANVQIDNLIIKDSLINISGRVSTEDLDIGKAIGKEILGPVTLKSVLSAKLGGKGAGSEVAIDTLKVDRLYANGYDYSDITATGHLSSTGFDGSIACHDPNLNFLFQGAFALSPKTQNARYSFFANIGHADLYALNIDKRGISRVNLRASADFTRSGAGDMRGKIDLADVVLQNSLGRNDIGDISLSSFSSDSTYTIRLDSGFADGTYSGSAPVAAFIRDIKEITLKKEIPALFTDSTYVWSGNSYGLTLRFNNSMDVLSYALPGLYIDEGTEIKASLDKKGILSASLKSNRLAFDKNYLKGVNAEFGNADEGLDALLRISEIKIAELTLKDSHLDVHGKDNHVGLKFDYDNKSELANSGEIILHSTFARDEEGLGIGVEFLPSSVFVNSKEWNFQPSSMEWRPGKIDVASFAVTSGDERISLAGKASQNEADTLNLNLERFDISVANDIIGKDLGIRGAATGAVRLTSPLNDKGILTDLICDSTYFAGSPLGTLHVGSNWNEEDQNFGILVRNEIDGRNGIDAFCTYTPEGRLIEATADLDAFSISYAQPVLSEVFSEMDGHITGRIDVSGPLSDLKIRTQDTKLEDGLLRIAYTNVPYHADGPFHLDETGAYFDGITIRDDYTGTGTVNGSINWNNFRDMSFNTQISVNEIEGINIVEDNGAGFYGRVFATGNLSLTGPANSILLTVDAVTAKDGQLHVPVSSATAAGKMANLLQFKEEEKIVKIDPYEAMMQKMEASRKEKSDFTVRLHINAQSDVEAYVEIDKASGNVLSGRGTGILDIEAGSDVFNITGDYILSNGNYTFIAMGLVRKDFQIENGSSIKFNGDIMNSTLDINAIYRTKASLSTLLADENSVSNKRNVNCGISITDRLSNPELTFSIQIPDLNPMIQSRVESALSTEDKVQKQFLSLILSNSFLPDEQSGIVNNSSMLYSNVTEILANQLNNIFQKLDIPLDLGLNYQPNESGNDIFDVAVSTQLFNNRVVVNGNLGNKQYSTSGNQNEVVGDLDIEIKLNRSGAFRLNLFSHSADQFSNYLDNSQRNGVGLMYQTEFNSFRRFISNIFKSKAKRQQAKMEEEQAMITGKKVNISIEAPEKKNRKDRNNGKQ